MKGYKTEIEIDTLENENFRKVLYTSNYLQLVLMSLRPGEEIGLETHKETDQFFRFENGQGKCIIDETQYEIESGDIIVVPAGAKHNVINTGVTELKLYTIYSPPHHRDGIVQPTKNDATNSKEEFDGMTTELRPTYEEQVFLK